MTEPKKAPARKRATAASAASAKASSRRSTLEIKIGVLHSPREITLDVDQSADDINKLLETAVKDGSTLKLSDVKGRQLILPADKISYIEIGEPEARRVGFSA